MSRLAAAAAWCVPLYVCVTHAAAMAVYSFSDVFTGVFAASMSTLTAVVMHDFFSEFAAVDAMQVLRAAQYTTLFALWMSGYSSNAAAVVQGFVMYGLYCAGDAAQQLRYEPLRSQVLHAAHHTATLLLLSWQNRLLRREPPIFTKTGSICCMAGMVLVCSLLLVGHFGIATFRESYWIVWQTQSWVRKRLPTPPSIRRIKS